MKCKYCRKPLEQNQIDFCNEMCDRGYKIAQAITPEENEPIQEETVRVENQRFSLFGRRYENCSFENFTCKNEKQKDVLAKVKAVTTHIKSGNGRIFAFVGGWGTGKDHLAAAIVKELPGKKILHTTVMKLSREIREAGRDKSVIGQQSIIDKYTSCFLLILNEIGIQSVTAFEHNIIHEIVDTHYRNMTSVLLISNEGKDKFQECIDFPGLHRVWDRLNDVIIFDWESERGKA